MLQVCHVVVEPVAVGYLENETEMEVMCATGMSCR